MDPGQRRFGGPLEECCPSHWDSPSPSLEQYIEEIGAKNFEATTLLGICPSTTILPMVTKAHDAAAKESLGLVEI